MNSGRSGHIPDTMSGGKSPEIRHVLEVSGHFQKISSHAGGEFLKNVRNGSKKPVNPAKGLRTCPSGNVRNVRKRRGFKSVGVGGKIKGSGAENTRPQMSKPMKEAVDVSDSSILILPTYPGKLYYPPAKKRPRVPGFLYREEIEVIEGRVDLGEWYVHVARCCYCGDEHQHVVCTPGAPDPTKYLGERMAYCAWSFLDAVFYEIIPISRRANAVTDQAWLDEHFPMHRARVGSLTIAGRVARQPLTPFIKNAVWAKTDGICWYCGAKLKPFDDFQVDHVVPVSKGGTNKFANLVPACRVCNSRKGNRSLDHLRKFMDNETFWFEEQWF